MVGTTAIRGVCPEYGEMRNEVRRRAVDHASDELERRHVVFLGGRLREQLFGGRPAVDETREDQRTALHGDWRDAAQDFSSAIIFRAMTILRGFRTRPLVTCGTRATQPCWCFSPSRRSSRKKRWRRCWRRLRCASSSPQPTKKAFQMFGRTNFVRSLTGWTIGLQVLLTFVGTLTLGIGGVGVMNIMLVSVDERIREIGLRRALGARKRHIKLQFLAETL